MSVMYFDFQMFKGNVSSTTTYQLSPEERALLTKQMGYLDEIYPNMIKLNTEAGNMLWDSMGTVKADYETMNKNAQDQIAQAQQGVSGLIKGELPQEYKDNMTAALQGGVQGTVGNMLNGLGGRGILNSSVTQKGMNDIEKNVSNTMAQQYNNNINTLSGLYGQQMSNATQPIIATSAAQEAAQQPSLNLWQASLGLNSAGSGTLASIAGKYGTTTTNQSSSGGGLGSLLGGVATGLAGNGGFWNYLK